MKHPAPATGSGCYCYVDNIIKIFKQGICIYKKKYITSSMKFMGYWNFIYNIELVPVNNNRKPSSFALKLITIIDKNEKVIVYYHTISFIIPYL